MGRNPPMKDLNGTHPFQGVNSTAAPNLDGRPILSAARGVCPPNLDMRPISSAALLNIGARRAKTFVLPMYAIDHTHKRLTHQPARHADPTVSTRVHTHTYIYIYI